MADWAPAQVNIAPNSPPPPPPLGPQVGWTVRVTRDGKPMPDAGVTVEGKSWITAGKLDSNDILAEHPTCSRTHCMFIVDQDLGVCAVDLGTANGTKLDGERLTPLTATPLLPSSEVAFAHANRRYSIEVTTNLEAEKKANLYASLGDLENPAAAAVSAEHTVFIHNLSDEVTEEKLKDFLLTNPQILEGMIARISMPLDKVTNKHRGIAFVDLTTPGAMMNAISMDGDMLEEKEVRLCFAQGGVSGAFQIKLTEMAEMARFQFY